MTAFRTYNAWFTRLLDKGVPTTTVGPGLAALLDGPGRRVFQLIPSLDPSFFRDQPPPHRSEREPRELTVLYTGRMSGEKGVDVLIRAFAGAVKAGNIRLRLRLVGDGPAMAPLRQEVTALGLDSLVTFVGKLPHGEPLRREYERADLFALTSHTEGVPRSLIEAMGMGVPAVATAVGGIPEVAEDGRTALLVPPGDAEAITRALVKLVEDPPLRLRLAAVAWHHAQQFLFDVQARRLLDILLECYPSLRQADPPRGPSGQPGSAPAAEE